MSSSYNLYLQCFNHSVHYGFNCGKVGHRKNDCRVKKYNSAGATDEQEDFERDAVETFGASSVITLKVKCVHMDNEDINYCLKNNLLILANAKSLNLVMNACQQNPGKNNMHIKQAFVALYRVIVLSDTCRGGHELL